MTALDEPESIVTVWKKINNLLITQQGNADGVAAIEEHSESLDRLAVGLHSLRRLKAAQKGIQRSGVFIETLPANSSVDHFINAIQKLSERDVLDEHYGDLQDTCSLIEDALNDLTSDEFNAVKNDLLLAFNRWSLFGGSQEELAEDEAIISDVVTTQDNVSSSVQFNDYITRFEGLTAQIEANSYSGLYSANLLIIEALQTLNTAITPELSGLLDNWSALVDAYQQKSPAAINGIMAVLRYPDLHIPLDEDDYAVFTTLLNDEIAPTYHPDSIALEFDNETEYSTQAYHLDPIDLAFDNEAEHSTQENHAGEALAKLTVGLNLLQQLRVAQVQTQHNTIVTEPLDDDSSIDDYVFAIQKLSEEAAFNDDYDLQDACLLLEEALSGLSETQFATEKLNLLASINQWSNVANNTLDIIVNPQPVLVETIAENADVELSDEAEQVDNTEVNQVIEPAQHDETLEKLNADVEQADETEQVDTAEVNQVTEPEQHEETLEKLAVALQLLKEFKASQGESQQYNILIKPLHTASTLEDYHQAVQALSAQADVNFDYDLQDACLLLEDTLRELSADDFALTKSDLSAALNDYISPDYQAEPLVETVAENEQADETEQVDNTEVNQVTEPEQQDETLEKLAVALQLLKEFKVSQGESQQYNILIQPLHTASTLEDYHQAVQALSAQADVNYDYDLQDACLLLEDSLRELSADDFALAKADLSVVLNDYLSADYQAELPVETATEIEQADVEQIDETEQVVDTAEVNQVTEPEQHDETLEKLAVALQLLKEFKVTQGESQQYNILIQPLHTASTLEDYHQAVQALSEQADVNFDYDLQDACLLLEDTLRELSADDFAISKADLSVALNDYLSPDYQAEPLVETVAENELADETEQVDTSEVNQVTEPEQPSETLETLAVALQLLQEFKTAQGESQTITVALKPLHVDSPIADYIQAVQKLSEQAVHHDEYDLQDACLLLEDSLTELATDDFSLVKLDVLSALNDYLSSDDQEELPEQIVIATNIDSHESVDHVSVQPSVSSRPTIADYIANIETLANEVNEAGYAALYDVSLIIIGALHELSIESETISITSDLPSLLDNWSTLISAYQQNSQSAIDGIMMVLYHPDLNISLDEDDFAVFTTMLSDDLTAQNESLQTVNISTSSIPVEPVIVQDADLPITTVVESSPVYEPIVEDEVLAETAGEDNEPVPALSTAAQELVELLDTEAGLLNYRFLAVDFDEPISERAENLQLASEELERLMNASRMVGFAGLAEACSHVNANIAVFLQQIDSFSLDKRDLLTDWANEVKAYLVVFSKKNAGKKLLVQMARPEWLQPLSAEASAALLPQMQVKGLSDDNPEQEVNEKIASDEDVSLALPDDVNKELLDLLLQELPGYTQQFSEAIQRLQAGGSSKDIDVAQRIAHTIKGSGNTVGIKGIAYLTHQIEDILMACAKAHKQPGTALINTLINASDCLEAMCESLLGFGEPPADARAVLQEVLDWAYRIAKNGIEEASSQNAPAKQQSTADSSTDDSNAQPQKDSKAEQIDSIQVPMVRVPTDQIENLFRLSSESIILNGQIYERQRRLKNQLQAMETQFALLQQLGAGLEQLIDLKDLSGRSLVNTHKDFDALEMDQYNELHTASRRMVEAAVDAREVSVDMKKELEYMNEVLEYQQHLVINTQEAVMQTRFVPVGSIVLRLQRGLRQTCRLTGKQGELVFSGESLLIDGDTLSALVEPLMHLLRNAIDHGLESTEERIAIGKPPVGKITIDFDREGNSILVRCRDDGRGLDFDAIRRTAEKRGDFKEGEIVTEDDLKRLILRPNFSTRTELTQTSGRGVGMDVVNFQILSLSGSLKLDSVCGKGLTVELRMPLPLSRSHALIAYAASYKVAISSKGITQVIYSGIGELTEVNHERVLVVGDDIYPVVRLEDLLHVVDRRKAKRIHGAVLLVQNEQKITAVLVNTIIDSREVVIKNLGYYMRKIHGFVGATILGDGSVTPVLDIPELLRSPVHARAVTSHHAEAGERVVDTGTSLLRILIVDDSLSQRRALQQILTDAGFRVQAVRDGIEAVEWFAHSKPDVVVTDLEMPRMNGIELASHIRSHANIQDLPIIMITSRSTQKHRQMAEEAGVDFYLIKPVQDDDLLTKIQSLIDKRRTAVIV